MGKAGAVREQRVRELSDAVQSAELAGRWGEAASAHARLAWLEREEPEHRVRLGHALVRTGRTAAAVDAYLVAARAFAEVGALEKAIACALVACSHRPPDRLVESLLAEWRGRRILRAPGVTPAVGLSSGEPAEENDHDLEARNRIGHPSAPSVDDAPPVRDGDLIPSELFDRLYATFDSARWRG